jgi:hypothetical protein
MPALNDPIWLAAAAAALLGTALAWLVWRRAADRPERVVTRAIDEVAADRLERVLLPDGMGGHVAFERLLLTPRGIVVVDTKYVRGAVFGSDRMDDWTVIANDRRYTFANPQHGLYDRVAAARALVGEGVPVDGVILFAPGGRFAKGVPGSVVDVETFRERYGGVPRRELGPGARPHRDAWDRLRDAAVGTAFERSRG